MFRSLKAGNGFAGAPAKARSILAGIVTGVSLLALSAPSHAGPITVGSWVGFCFAGVGSGATAGCQNDASQTSGNSFTFNLLGSGLLRVVDAFNRGDRFDVFDGATLLFSTSLVPIGSGSTTDPDTAFADPTYSSGSILLGSGAHSINIRVTASPFGGGGAYLEVSNAVPEPATLSLLGLGLAGLGFVRRRKMQASA